MRSGGPRAERPGSPRRCCVRCSIISTTGQGSRHDPRLSKLTARERDIVQLMVDGLGRQRMAEQLNLSIDTVRTHMRTMMQKLDVHSATATVSVALEAGLRPTPSRGPSVSP